MGVDDTVGRRLRRANGFLGDGHTSSAAITRSAVPVTLREQVTSAAAPGKSARGGAPRRLLAQGRHVEDHAGLALDMRGHAEQRAEQYVDWSSCRASGRATIARRLRVARSSASSIRTRSLSSRRRRSSRRTRFPTMPRGWS